MATPRKAVPPTDKPDFAALLAGAKLPERTVPICLRADLVAEHEELDRELGQLIDKGPPQKFGGDGRGELRQRIEALEAEMNANTYPFRFRGLPQPAWLAFVAEYPPRKDDDGEVHEDDLQVGVNMDVFPEALIRRCCIDPVLDDKGWRELLGDSDKVRAQLTADGKQDEIENGKLTNRQLELLFQAPWNLNRRDVDVPFSRAVSRLNQSSSPE